MLKHVLVLAVLFAVVLACPVSAGGHGRRDEGRGDHGRRHSPVIVIPFVHPRPIPALSHSGLRIEARLRSLKLVRNGRSVRTEVFTGNCGLAFPVEGRLCSRHCGFTEREIADDLDAFVLRPLGGKKLAYGSYRIYYCFDPHREKHVTGVTIEIVKKQSKLLRILNSL